MMVLTEPRGQGKERMAKFRTTGKTMNRRSFVKSVGFLATGSTLCSSLLSCSVNTGINIPCLGTAPVPEPVPGMTYIRASQIGCALDCDLTNGRNKHTGEKATDDGPRINAAMAGASASNPMTLIIDGSALISGLFLPAGGYWSIVGLGCGTGFFIKSGTNNDGIHNGDPTAGIPGDPGPPAPPRGSSVSLRNFTINGNQGDGHNGDSTTGKPRGNDRTTWYFCVNLMNLNNIDIENLVIVDSPAYHIRFSNTGNVNISGCILRSEGANTDGFHFDGPANDITISNCDLTTGDDSIALNCPEGYTGDIVRVAVSNCTFNSTQSFMRIYTKTYGDPHRFNINTVTVSNCRGTATITAFLFGQSSDTTPESITGVNISDCHVIAPAALELGANFGNITVNNVTLVPRNTFAPLQAPGLAFVRSSGYLVNCTYVGTSLTLNNCVVQRGADIAVAALIVEYNSLIKNVIFNGFAVNDLGHYAMVPELVNFVSGSIRQLIINQLERANIREPVSTGGFSSIESVAGIGVLATRWEFPDAVMADGVPYISASSGLPSIKVGGVVESYSG